MEACGARGGYAHRISCSCWFVHKKLRFASCSFTGLEKDSDTPRNEKQKNAEDRYEKMSINMKFTYRKATECPAASVCPKSVRRAVIRQ